MTRAKSDSRYNSDMEIVVREQFGQLIGKPEIKLEANWPIRDTDEEFSVNIDIFHAEDDRIILAEIFTHVGELKPGQKRKIATDMLKLVFIKEYLASKPEHEKKEFALYIATNNAEIKTYLDGKSWHASVAKMFSIRCLVAELTPDQHRELYRVKNLQDVTKPD